MLAGDLALAGGGAEAFMAAQGRKALRVVMDAAKQLINRLYRDLAGLAEAIVEKAMARRLAQHVLARPNEGAENATRRPLALHSADYYNRIKLGVNDAKRAEIALRGTAGKRLTHRRINEA